MTYHDNQGEFIEFIELQTTHAIHAGNGPDDALFRAERDVTIVDFFLFFLIRLF